MAVTDPLPALTSLVILVVAVTAGPVFGFPGPPSESGCQPGGPIGTGQASVTVTDLPESATLERSRFGAEAWLLDVDHAQTEVGPVVGQPIVTYKLRVDGPDLGLAAAATAILSRCEATTRIVIEQSQFSPRKLDQDAYDGTITVTYRGTRNGEAVVEQLATRNVTVQVDR